MSGSVTVTPQLILALGETSKMGTLKNILFELFVVVCFFSLFNYGTQGGRISISKEEDVELERQLKILNKPPIKTFHTEWGDIVDCVDIHKQPAFDHPSLKSHKIQMRPSSSPKMITAEKTSKLIESKPSHIRTDGIECPEGTVPFKRTTKEDLIRAKSFSKTTNSANVAKQEIYAHLRLESFDEGEKYFGANTDMYVYNPAVGDDQFSGSQLWIESGNPMYQFNSIQTGWMVAPELYKDHQTRLFTYWAGDGSYVSGCYDTLCPGFVQIDRTLYPSAPFINISTYGGQQYYVHLYVFQDKSGDWWLSYKDNVRIGYWPKALFNGLKEGASKLRWGGRVSVSETGMSPPMGSGHYPDGQPTHSCYFHHVMYLDDHGELINLENGNGDLVKETNCPFYRIGLRGYVPDLGTVFEVGGPGGKCRII